MTGTMRRHALRFAQDAGHALYFFALKPVEIDQLAEISRLSRGDDRRLLGYQRREIREHIDAIRGYLDRGNVLFPNAIILAFDDEVKFRSKRGPAASDGLATQGSVELRIPEQGATKPAWIVDGQQRAIALSGTRNRSLPVPIAAFDRAGIALQREQFLTVNSVRPLDTRLVTELLPEVDRYVPPRLAGRRVPAQLCEILDSHPDSPFRGLIRRPSNSGRKESRVVVDTALVKMLQERLSDTSGSLLPYYDSTAREIDTGAAVQALFAFWSSVRETFPEAWALPPSQSRLMHGAGIQAMGALMDAILARTPTDGTSLRPHCMAELGRIRTLCHWTGGRWDPPLDLPWNEVGNTPQVIRRLAQHLVIHYKRALGTP